MQNANIQRCLIYLLLIFAAGCRQAVANTPTPSAPEVVAQVTSTPLLPATSANTPADTPIPTPTATVAATTTPAPTHTLTASSTPTRTPSPTSTPTAVALWEAADFGPARSPFTGEIVARPSNLWRRPIALKISNGPAEWVRPQSGLSQADIVFEHLAEGITRFTAIFHSQTPPDVGPLRSARLIDLELSLMYETALGFSGAHQYTLDLLEDSAFSGRLLRSYEPGYYRTGEDKPYEHTFYAQPAMLWGALEANGQNSPPPLAGRMPFTELPPAGGAPAGWVSIDYNQTVAEWTYDPGNGRYWRVSDGEALLDANNNLQISAANVAVIFVRHRFIEGVCVFSAEGDCIVYPIEIQLWEQGEALLFRDGQVYSGEWQRPAEDDVLRLVNDAGDVLPFQIGNTWFQVVPVGWYEEPVTYR